LNPGDAVFATAYLQSHGTASENFTFALDISLGHQRRPENKQYHFRVLSSPIPSTKSWAEGLEVAVAFRFEHPGCWAGTYFMTLSMLDRKGILQPFMGANGETLSEEAGSIDLSWNFGRPWVFEHSKPGTLIFNAPAPYPEFSGLPTIPRATVRNTRTGEILDEGCLEIERKDGAFRLFYNSLFIARYEFCFRKRERLSAWVQNVEESNGFELLSVRIGCLACIKEGSLLDFFGGGRLVGIEEAGPAYYEKPYDVRNAAALIGHDKLILVESSHLDSRLITGVACVNNTNWGFIGGVIVLKIAGKVGVTSIPVKSPPVFELEIFPGCHDWKFAAEKLQRGLSQNFAHSLYDKTAVIKQLATYGALPDESHRGDPVQTTQNLFKTLTFSQILDNAKKFSNLVNHAKLALYVGGWQKGGFDNAYPYALEAEERCGGTEGLKNLLADLEDQNVMAGFHDNFDDIAFGNADCPHVALDESGNPWKGWIWGSGLTYATGIRNYVDSGAMAERVAKLFETYPLKRTYHLDVLTAETIRLDFSPDHPASAQDSYLAKMEIVEEFNKRGVDVTSEMLSHPSVGKIGFALHTRLDTKESYIPNDRFVPLAHMVYHGFIGYSCPTGSAEQIIWAILLGGQAFLEEDITGPESVARFYIASVPALLLYNERMTDFSWDGSLASATYTNGCLIEADFKKPSYKAFIRSQLIGQDFTTFASLDGNDYVAYSVKGGEISYPLPKELDGFELEAAELTEDGKGCAVQAPMIRGKEICLTLPASKPILIKRHDPKT
jgi:hypothetical protein